MKIVKLRTSPSWKRERWHKMCSSRHSKTLISLVHVSYCNRHMQANLVLERKKKREIKKEREGRKRRRHWKWYEDISNLPSIVQEKRTLLRWDGVPCARLEWYYRGGAHILSSSFSLSLCLSLHLPLIILAREREKDRDKVLFCLTNSVAFILILAHIHAGQTQK